MNKKQAVEQFRTLWMPEIRRHERVNGTGKPDYALRKAAWAEFVDDGVKGQTMTERAETWMAPDFCDRRAA